MLEIVRVDIVDGQTLDIELSNGHLILFDTQRLPSAEHSYDGLRDLEVLPRPVTDGQSVFWQGGPRLALTDLLCWLSTQDTNEVESDKAT